MTQHRVYRKSRLDRPDNFMGNRILERLAELSMTQAELGDKTGASPKTISGICSGRIKRSTFLVEIANALGVTYDYLTRGQMNVEAENPKIKDIMRIARDLSEIHLDMLLNIARQLEIGSEGTKRYTWANTDREEYLMSRRQEKYISEMIETKNSLQNDIDSIAKSHIFEGQC